MEVFYCYSSSFGYTMFLKNVWIYKPGFGDYLDTIGPFYTIVQFYIFIFLQRFSRQICFVTYFLSLFSGSRWVKDIDWHHYFTYRLGIVPKGEHNDI